MTTLRVLHAADLHMRIERLLPGLAEYAPSCSEGRSCRSRTDMDVTSFRYASFALSPFAVMAAHG